MQWERLTFTHSNKYDRKKNIFYTKEKLHYIKIKI